MSKISTLIVSYNEREFIERAIKSVVEQYVENDIDIEIIIGDDGSDDGSVEKIEILEDNINNLYKGKGIVVHHFVMQRPISTADIIPSIRVSAIIKKGLQLATGEYIACLSADDAFCDDTKFSTAVHFLNEHPDFCAYISGFRKVGLYEETRVLTTESPTLYWSGCYHHLSCFVFRRMDPALLLNRFCDDVGLEFTLAKMGRWKADPAISFEYLQRSESIMHSSRKTELLLLEAMIYQDVLNDNCGFNLRCAAGARVYKKIKALFKERNNLGEKAFSKYFTNSALYDNNVIWEIKNYTTQGVLKKLEFKLKIFCLAVDYYIFKIMRIIDRGIKK